MQLCAVEQFLYQNAACQRSLRGAPAEVCEDAGLHDKRPQSSQAVEPLARFWVVLIEPSVKVIGRQWRLNVIEQTAVVIAALLCYEGF